MGNTIYEGKHPGEFILYTEEKYSVDQVGVAAAAGALVPGTVLGRITATGEYVAYNNAAADGSEVARAINIHAVPDAASVQSTTAITRQAEVVGSLLTGLDTAARADLAAVGIIVR